MVPELWSDIQTDWQTNRDIFVVLTIGMSLTFHLTESVSSSSMKLKKGVLILVVSSLNPLVNIQDWRNCHRNYKWLSNLHATISLAIPNGTLVFWARSLHRKWSCSSRTLGDDMLAARCLMLNSYLIDISPYIWWKEWPLINSVILRSLKVLKLKDNLYEVF